jgi:ParB-like chromosome segregation protein Spo0J
MSLRLYPIDHDNLHEQPIAQEERSDSGPGFFSGLGKVIQMDLSELSSLPFSYGRPIEPLVQSIKTLGLMRPLWLVLDGNGLPTVISGSRRLEALRLLGLKSAPCWLPIPKDPMFDRLPANPNMAANLIMAAITDNLDRGFNQAELVLVWQLALKEAPGEALPEIARLLGFKHPSNRTLALEKAATLPSPALELLSSGKLDPENALTLSSWNLSEQVSALNLMARVGPSRQNRRLWLEWLDDLRRSEGLNFLSEFLTLSTLSDLSGPEAEKKARDYIRGRRFPYLTELSQKREQILQSLNLPTAFKLELDPDFEDVLTTLKLTFSESNELIKLASFALNLAQGGSLEKLWSLNDQSLPDPSPIKVANKEDSQK